MRDPRSKSCSTLCGPSLRYQTRSAAFVSCAPRRNKSSEPDSLLVRLSFTKRDLRLSFAPAIYYLKPHYEGYECVLARVKLLDDDALTELLETDWQFVGSTKATKTERRS